jgi:hypothetical protein
MQKIDDVELLEKMTPRSFSLNVLWQQAFEPILD